MLNNKNWEKKGGRGKCSKWWCLSAQGTIMCDECDEPCSWNICLLMGSTEWIHCFALLVHTAFALPSEMFLSQLMRFTLLPSWFSPLSHLGSISKWLCGAEPLLGSNLPSQCCDFPPTLHYSLRQARQTEITRKLENRKNN